MSENTWFTVHFVDIVGFVHDNAVLMSTFSETVIAFECVVGTFCAFLYTGAYEKVFAGVYFALPWVIGFLARLMEELDLLSPAVRNLLYLSFNIICLLLLVMLVLANKSAYRRTRVGNVNRKFQISVRLRTVRTMTVVVLLSLLRNLFTSSLMMVIIFYFSPNCMFQDARMSAHYFDLTVSVYCAFFAFPVIFSNQEMAQIFRKDILRRNAVASSARLPRDPVGRQLVNTQGQDQYFHALKSSWE